ncbi:FMN-binding negative transcriptional regulator [Xanthomonas arboricola pv. corylina]|uniref:Protease synthase and sporulation protein PAI 2 n=1 Tax=Xanthomonas arboricola pv. corylina TaxID=487821 RepID=A0A2S7C6F9_9XANT|nr:FMN-binding negative transcriptional regulator [Xanthomonas arboricola]MDN0202662.1 FMN-binding negative transcriptional regulator [Xanthomonas arboricola pv. corylina]MDN0206379.1 FMN-binding negative transcriptional regulator [Xanthomonas arboricola pv. corylina]MDN0210824.1 FMN-binding negative transcriptional regulator [Xanthomonas arboricola pv. corylina]MDN0215215.1 FMN-binding negative transcriptional regulator [Xanthomonas arboricola pv. corylina]PPU15686.1 FMN-binding negative tran
MYAPRVFAQTDLALLDWLIARDPFVTLISQGEDGQPAISHLPVLYRRDAQSVVIEGHWARPNPQARSPGEAVLVVQGPHAYVSPSWYPDKEAAARVPTWNYAVAHLHGRCEQVSDEAALGELIGRMSTHFEQRVGSDWLFEMERDSHRRQLRGLVGFRFVPSRIELTFKLSQNHPAANQRSVSQFLAQQPDQASNAIAALMQAAMDANPTR